MHSEKYSNENSKKFLLAFAVPLAAFSIVALISMKFLKNVGETKTIASIVETQQRNGAIYGTALFNDDYVYKLLLMEKNEFEMAILGSSRALPAVSEMFKQKFINLGRAANTTRHLLEFSEKLAASRKPNLIIITIDPWWINADNHEPTSLTDTTPPPRVTPEALIAPIKWQIEKKLNFQQITNVLTNSQSLKFGNFPVIGVRALTHGTGFAPDGSRSDPDVIYGRRDAKDIRFKFSLSEVLDDWRGNKIDVTRVLRIKKSIENLRNTGAEIITIIPPVAPRLFAALKATPNEYGAIWELQSIMKTISPNHYDFLNPKTVNAQDCEFLDGFHGGQVVFAKMLKHIAETQRRFSGYFDTKILQMMIDCCAGHAIALSHFIQEHETELDFLKIGCVKNDASTKLGTS